MKVSALKAKIHRIWVVVPGEEGEPEERIWVDYRPGALTLNTAEDLKVAMLSGLDSDAAFVMLRGVIAAWDLENDDGSQLGTSDEEIKTVPLTFLGMVMGAIQEDSRPNLQRGVTSDGSLPQTEPQEVPQNGTTSSELPTAFAAPPGSS